jgi:nucleotide-binding universal stress UspA family protein
MQTGYQRLLVPVVGSAIDRKAIELVGDMACRQPVDVTLVYVVEVEQAMPLDSELPAAIDHGEAALLAAERHARLLLGQKHERLNTDLLQARSAGAAIVDEAIERRAHKIVIAAKNHTLHGKVVMGDTVSYVLKNAPCDVVLVRQATESDARRDQGTA